MTGELGFVNLLLVAVVAVVAPLVAAVLPIRIPSVVLEIVAGIVLGPSVLGWIEIDEPVTVLALVGLSFLLFLAGLEIDVRGLRGDLLRLPLLGFALTIVIGLGLGFAAMAVGWIESPFFLAVALGATSLGIVAPLLKDAAQAATPLGQYTLAGATIADFSTILLLSLVFAESGSTGGRLLSLGWLVLAVGAAAVALELGHSNVGFGKVLLRLQDSTAAIRVRIAVALMLSFVALAGKVGVETILGAFVAGTLLAFVDSDSTTHPHFRLKLESIGFGFLVPVFFVTSGLRFDLASLQDEPATLLRVPAFVVALLMTRGLPAAIYARTLGRHRAVTAGLLQATSLPFIVAATQIGVSVEAVSPATAASLVAAGLVSTIVFPTMAAARLAETAVTRVPTL